MLPGDMGRTGRQWNVISEPYPGLRGYATAYSWNPLRKGLLTGIYVLPNSSRFFSMRFTPLNSRIFLHLNPKSHLLSNLKGRRLQIYLRPFSWLILRLLKFVSTSPEAPGLGRLPNKHFRGASGPVKMESVFTLALLAGSAPTENALEIKGLRFLEVCPHSGQPAR